LVTNKQHRYKDDVFDRIWYSQLFNNNWARLSTSLHNDDLLQNNFEPPAIVMSSALTPVNAGDPLELQWNAGNGNDQYYLYMYFNEVENLAPNETRAFNITVNDEFWYGPVIPIYRKVKTIFSTTPLTGGRSYLVSLSKIEKSTLPPILNAFEVYKVKDFSQPETEQDDGKQALQFIYLKNMLPRFLNIASYLYIFICVNYLF